MTPIDIKKKDAKSAEIQTTVGGSQLPASPSASVESDPLAAYKELYEKPKEKTKRKGRGPSPYYKNAILAYVELNQQTTEPEELVLNLEKLRALMGKPGFSVKSIQQALNYNLGKMFDADGRPLRESILVRVDQQADTITLVPRPK